MLSVCSLKKDKMFFPRKLVGWCLSLPLLLDVAPASAAWVVPRNIQKKSKSQPLQIASTETCNERSFWNVVPHNATDELSPIEATIDSQWKALQQEQSSGGRATFSIPRNVPSGTHSIDKSYGLYQTQGTEEEMAAAMDLILLSKEEKEPRRRFDFGGPLKAAMEGAMAALTVLSYVLGETSSAMENPDDSSKQRLAKISRSFQGVVELSKEFVKSLFSVVLYKSVEESINENSVQYSATLPVQGEPETSKQEKGTIAIADPADDQWRKVQSNVGLWTDHVAHTTASTASSVAEQVGTLTNEIAQGTVDSTFAFQETMTRFFEQGEEDQKPKKAFYFANKSPSRSVHPEGYQNAFASTPRNGTLYFTTA